MEKKKMDNQHKNHRENTTQDDLVKTVMGWYRERQDAEAQPNPNAAYDTGQDVSPDCRVAALEWFPGVAKQGCALFQCVLGRMYLEGQGYPQDLRVAAKWFLLAAKQGDPEAQCRLGEMFYRGEGVPQNDAFAHMLVDLSVSSGCELCCGLKAEIAAQMTPPQISEAKRLANEWIRNNLSNC